MPSLMAEKMCWVDEAVEGFGRMSLRNCLLTCPKLPSRNLSSLPLSLPCLSLVFSSRSPSLPFDPPTLLPLLSSFLSSFPFLPLSLFSLPVCDSYLSVPSSFLRFLVLCVLPTPYLVVKEGLLFWSSHKEHGRWGARGRPESGPSAQKGHISSLHEWETATRNHWRYSHYWLQSSSLQRQFTIFVELAKGIITLKRWQTLH